MSNRIDDQQPTQQTYCNYFCTGISSGWSDFTHWIANTWLAQAAYGLAKSLSSWVWTQQEAPQSPSSTTASAKELSTPLLLKAEKSVPTPKQTAPSAPSTAPFLTLQSELGPWIEEAVRSAEEYPSRTEAYRKMSKACRLGEEKLDLSNIKKFYRAPDLLEAKFEHVETLDLRNTAHIKWPVSFFKSMPKLQTIRLNPDQQGKTSIPESFSHLVQYTSPVEQPAAPAALSTPVANLPVLEKAEIRPPLVTQMNTPTSRKLEQEQEEREHLAKIMQSAPKVLKGMTEFTASLDEQLAAKATTLTFTGYKNITLPVTTNKYPFVTTLKLNYMLLTDLPDGFLQQFPNLTTLDLDENSLKKIPESIQEAKKLISLSINNNLIRKIPQWLRNSPAGLTSLDLSMNLLGSNWRKFEGFFSVKGRPELTLTLSESSINRFFKARLADPDLNLKIQWVT